MKGSDDDEVVGEPDTTSTPVENISQLNTVHGAQGYPYRFYHVPWHWGWGVGRGVGGADWCAICEKNLNTQELCIIRGKNGYFLLYIVKIWLFYPLSSQATYIWCVSKLGNIFKSPILEKNILLRPQKVLIVERK